MALAAILSYALLATASIQAAQSNNQIAAAIAQAQAESGVKLAMYYLLNPQYAPSLLVSNSVPYWPGSAGSPVTFATTGSPSAQMPGWVTISVTPPANQMTNTYTVVATGYSSGVGVDIGTGTQAITRTITAQVELTYQVQQALALNQSAPIIGSGVTIIGSPTAIRAAGTLTLDLGASISGAISALNLLQIPSGLFNGTLLSAPGSAPAPTSSSINHYATYLYQGTIYSAAALSGGTLSSGTIPAYDPVHNPLNVFYYTGNITLAGNVNFQGTLIAVNGNIIAQSANNVITAYSTMPALVADKSLEVKSSNASLTVNGPVYAGSGIASGGGINTGSKIVINGGMLIDSGLVTPPTGSTLSITYNSTYASAPALSSVANAVQLVSWSQ